MTSNLQVLLYFRDWSWSLSSGPRISPRPSQWMLVLGHLLQLHRIFLSICLTFQKQETSPDIRIPVRSEGVCHQDVVKLTSLPPFLTMEMPNVFWHFRTFKTSQINLGNLSLPAPSGHNPSQGDLSHYLPADTEWVSPGMAVSYSSHYLQPGWLCWKDSLLCYSQGEVYRNQINTFLFCLLPSCLLAFSWLCSLPERSRVAKQWLVLWEAYHFEPLYS